MALASAFSRRYSWAGYLLGAAAGGFFDGILLHQILQWHHLLSAVEDFGDLRFQIAADGVFHAAMYVVAAAGLWLLWRSRAEFSAAGAGRLLGANVMIGFGAWHLVDAVLSHWLLGIHRIRMDADNLLLWDLAWFFLFGVLFVAAGGLLRRRTGGPPSAGRRRFAAPAVLSLMILVAGPLAGLPPPDSTTVVVLFRPGITAEEAFAALAKMNGRAMWSDSGGRIWSVSVEDPAQARLLYRHGALLVSNTFVSAGCLAWLRA